MAKAAIWVGVPLGLAGVLAGVVGLLVLATLLWMAVHTSFGGG